MKIRHRESLELLIMTCIGVIACVVAIVMHHPRLFLMIVLTAIMAGITFIARFRHRRSVETLHAKGRRRKKATTNTHQS